MLSNTCMRFHYPFKKPDKRTNPNGLELEAAVIEHYSSMEETGNFQCRIFLPIIWSWCWTDSHVELFLHRKTLTAISKGQEITSLNPDASPRQTDKKKPAISTLAEAINSDTWGENKYSWLSLHQRALCRGSWSCSPGGREGQLGPRWHRAVTASAPLWKSSRKPQSPDNNQEKHPAGCSLWTQWGKKK